VSPLATLLSLALAAPPLSPEEALKRFHIAPGFRLELAASEPEVVDPIDLAFDAHGRLFVVELRDYPSGPPAGSAPLSRIRELRDADSDGLYETAVDFAEGLSFATGIQPWRGGLIVTAGAEVLFLEDSDGDGHADKHERWFEGLATANPQLRANSPTFGLDGWIYVANGLRSTELRTVGASSAAPLSIRNADFRFDPFERRAEAVAGHGQFGMAFDEWGRRFVCSNRNPLVHVVLPLNASGVNPDHVPAALVHDAAAAAESSRVFPLTRNWTTSHLHAGTFTAACGIHIYREALLRDLRGDAFVCEPTGNLVRRYRLHPDGATFRAAPAYEGREFLASEDEWFRPVNLESGPDGFLYIADMYRAVIEHPEWMPAEEQRGADFAGGTTRGRIWRLVPDCPPQARLRIEHLRPPATREADDMPQLLVHPGAWWRETAQRLLIEALHSSRNNGERDAAIRALRGLARSSREASSLFSAVPIEVAHALWTLERLGALDDEVLGATLGSAHARLREQGLRILLGRRGDLSSYHERLAAAARTETDDTARLWLALALARLDPDAKLDPLAALAAASAGDRWLREAVLLASSGAAGRLASRLVGPAGRAAPLGEGLVSLSEDLAALAASQALGSSSVSSGDRRELARVLEAGAQAASSDSGRLRRRLLRGLGSAAARRGRRLEDLVGAVEPRPVWIRESYEDSAVLACSAEAAFADRREAVEVLAHAPWELARSALQELVAGEAPPELRLAAVRALGSQDDEAAAMLLVESWKPLSPPARGAAAGALVSRSAWARRFAGSIAAGEVAAAEVPAQHRDRLVRHSDAEVRRLAAEAFGGASSGRAERAKALEAFRPALKLPGDRERGREVFVRACASCHRVGGVGVDVGPEIADSRTRTPEALLADILDPNQAIDGAYLSYTVLTRDGRALTGLLAAETASGVVLKQAEGRTETVPGSEVASLRSDGVSLMPEGLEKSFSLQDLADLIVFVKTWRY
jgi:putative membrane-bound dehydrogenase-like protein